jgi:hypothetical protein
MDSPKYNRTFHLPWSPGGTSDDKIATSVDNLIGKPIIITEKIDGSNTSLETKGCFARTHSGAPSHPSFDGLKALHATLKHKIPANYQMFGEWCYALHSIAYNELPGYFLLFNIRELNEVLPTIWLSWAEVKMWAEDIGVPTVPVLFEGIVKSESELKILTESFMKEASCCGGIREGVVVRLANQFQDNDFSNCVMKCVRANHVQTSDHWKDQEIIKNKLKS